MTASSTGLRSVVVPVEGVHVETLDDEKVLFVPSGQTLHHLDQTAALVWDCLLPPAPLQEIVADLSDAFGADPDVVAADVTALLEQLRLAGAVIDVEEMTPDA